MPASRNAPTPKLPRVSRRDGTAATPSAVAGRTVRAILEASHDQVEIDRWLDRAVTATTAAEVVANPQ